MTELADPTRTSTGYYWWHIVKFLARNRQVHLICPAADTEPYEGTPSVVGLAVRGPVRKPGGLTLRALVQVRLSLAMAFTLLRHAKTGDTVISGTNPAPGVLFISLGARLRGCRWILLCHDVFPENLVPAGACSERQWYFRISRALFGWCYRQANVILAIGRDMQLVLERKRVPVSRIRFVPNWTEPCYPPATDPGELRDRLGWRDRVIFLFFGNMGRVQGIDVLLAAIRRVSDPRLAFLFVGSGHLARAVADAASSWGVGRVAYLREVPVTQSGEIYGMCDASLVSLAPGMFGLGVPSKAYFSLAANKPILAVTDAESEIALLVREHDVGWWAPAGDCDAIAAALERGPAALRPSRFGDRPVTIARRYYSAARSLERIEEAVEGLYPAIRES